MQVTMAQGTWLQVAPKDSPIMKVFLFDFINYRAKL